MTLAGTVMPGIFACGGMATEVGERVIEHGLVAGEGRLLARDP